MIKDLAEHMLAVAREKAAQEGIAKVEFREADADTLPFPDNAFDEGSCRHGFMFFPDMTERYPNGDIDGCGVVITGVK